MNKNKIVIMELIDFEDKLYFYLEDNGINYRISGVAVLENDKRIYSASLIYTGEGKWPEPKFINFLSLRKICQSISLPNRMFLNTFICTFIKDGETHNRLQIWFK